jgi:hypothetical protein
MSTHGISSKLDGRRVFPQAFEAKSNPSGTSRRRGGLKTDICLKTVPKHENKNYDHFTPISGQGSTLTNL